MDKFNPEFIGYPEYDYESMAEIATKHGKYEQWAQFYHKPDMFEHEGQLYFVTSGKSDDVSFYIDSDGRIFELSINTALGYAGLAEHYEGVCSNIVFLTGVDYSEAEIDIDDSFEEDVLEYLMKWYN